MASGTCVSRNQTSEGPGAALSSKHAKTPVPKPQTLPAMRGAITISISRQLYKLANEALDLAVDCFAAGEHNPFIILVDAKGRSHLLDIKDATGNIGPHLLAQARRVVSDVGPKRYAIAYDAYLTTDGAKRDAALVEIGERDNPDAFVVAQRYRPQKALKGFRKLGHPTLVASADPLLLKPSSRTRRRLSSRGSKHPAKK